MRTERARKVIGVPISDDEMATSFERLGLAFTREADRFVVTPPSWRFDLQIEEDLIEEVVRVWGFERLPVRPPRASSPMLAQPERERSLSLLKRAVAARDYQEIVTSGSCRRICSRAWAMKRAFACSTRSPRRWT
jgi:phenylalanyl-tRNA synthetase beta chain